MMTFLNDISKRMDMRWWLNPTVHKWLLILLIGMLYANTLGHQYTLDDAIVIYNNEFTQRGVDGVPDLLQYDTFRGFFKAEGKDQLVSGGRYRPLTPVSFAIEHQLFGRSPLFGHIVNVLSYILLVLLIYSLLVKLLVSKNITHASLMAVIISLLFALHPIHTEVVANIKGRDEIWALGWGLCSFWWLVKSKEQAKHAWRIVLSGLFLFLALLSKENAIVFVLLIPLGLYIFCNKSLGASIRASMGVIMAALLYLIIRFSVLGWHLPSGTPMELMNNPFLQWQGDHYEIMNIGDRLGIIFYTLGKYLLLLFWPHPLTHDYYPRHIPIVSITNIGFVVSVLLYLALTIWGIIAFKKKQIHAFGIAFYLVPLLLVSNLIFPIGTNMGERFIFFSSLGWSIIIGYYLMHFIQKKKWMGIALSVLIVVGFSYKTITRNRVWKDDYTLFTTDVQISEHSAKAQNAAAGALTSRALNEPDGKKKNELYARALNHSKRAIQIHPAYANAYLIMGISQYALNSFDEAIQSFQKALALKPDFDEARHNLFLSYREAGKFYGEIKRDPNKALSFFQKAYTLDASDSELWRLTGIAYGVLGNPEQAINWFKKILALNPDDARALLNMSISYRLLNEQQLAEEYFQRAIKIDPEIQKNR